MIASSPWRSPAVVLGVPVATVLATMGSNAMLGGVIPSAEETPLQAESPVGTPTAALPGPLSWPSSWSPTATDDVATDRDAAGDARGAAAGTARVADGSTARPAVTSDAGSIRVVREEAEQVAERGDGALRERAGSSDESDGRPAGSVATVVSDPESAESAAPEPSVSSVSPSSTDRVPQVSTASPVAQQDRADDSGESEDEGSVVDLDTPAGGLSVLSFG